MSDPVVVIGAGLAGWRVADGVAQHDPGRKVIVLGAESRAPYDRPPLSKQALVGSRGFDDLTLQRSSDAGEIDLRLDSRVVAASMGHVQLESGEQIPAGEIVWATGVEPVRPGWVPDVPNVHVLRTIEDSQRLGAHLVARASLVIIGGGFIGCEIAAAAVSRGVKVTVIEMAEELLFGAVHRDIGQLVRSLHQARGVDIRTCESVTDIESTRGGIIVRTEAGSYPADAVVVGIGARADLQVLGDLPLEDGGIACDSTGRVQGRPGHWAAGDIATWHDPVLGRRRRREHWTTATAQASIVAMDVVGAEIPPALLHQPPYAWSDQYDVKVQVLGWPEAGDRQEWLERDGATGAVGYFAGDSLAGVMTVGAPRLLMKHRAAINAFAKEQLARA